MPKNQVDWHYIRLRYESGDSAYMIAKALGGRPTKQGIENRAKREGWQRQTNTVSIARNLPIVQRALELSQQNSKATAERIGFALDLISRGSTEALAATAAGVTPETWSRWKREDKQLAEQVRQCRAGKVAEWISRIDTASARDWKAAQALLQAAPEAEGFQGSHGGSGITVVLNIDRDKGQVVSEQ